MQNRTRVVYLLAALFVRCFSVSLTRTILCKRYMTLLSSGERVESSISLAINLM